MALLTNENIRLRALEPEDLELIFRWENDTSLWAMGNTLSPYSRYTIKEYIQDSRQHDIYELRQLRLMIEIVATEDVIGMIDLYDFEPYHKRAGVGILIDLAYRKKGYATNALNLLLDYTFSFLKIHQLYVYIPEKNQSSRSLFKYCGFVEKGVLSDWIMTPEGYQDVICMQKVSQQLSD